MSTIARFWAGLRFCRDFSLRLLQELNSEEDWLFRATYQSNHALWFAGHMGAADNTALSWIAPERHMENEEFVSLFAMGSKPLADAEFYPSISAVRRQMGEPREVLLEVVDGLTDDDQSTPTQGLAPALITDFGSVLQFLTWHEGMHVGQITVAHRTMGCGPLMGRPDNSDPGV